MTTKQFTLNRAEAFKFVEKYKDTTEETQYSQQFWADFFRNIVGIADTSEHGIEYEFRVGKDPVTNRDRRADVLWERTLLIEQKSTGRDLDKAEKQVRAYRLQLSPVDRPRFLLVCDFQQFRLVDVDGGETVQFTLAELPDHLHRFEAIFNDFHTDTAVRVDVEANADAVEVMTDLYRSFVEAGYDGHDLSVLLIRVLFLNFGDDTSMWRKGLFAELMRETAEAGWTTGPSLNEIFRLLDTPVERRTGDSPLHEFPYVNGGVFGDELPVFNFTADMRTALLHTTEYDWSQISPAIFGAMFQTVKDKVERRKLGEHYTSEANIRKLINPLFLDELGDKLKAGWHSPSSLRAFRQHLGQLNFLDPAAGSGNFLIVAYRELRRLEHEVLARLKELLSHENEPLSTEEASNVQVSLTQFHAIEVNEWSSQIARVAMYITKHQMNLELEKLSIVTPPLFPFTTGATVVHSDALNVQWDAVCPMGKNTIIMGNPPFIGGKRLTADQRAGMTDVFDGRKGTGNLDFVAAWFYLASQHIKDGGRAGFVSTNSITQGEQAATLWSLIHEQGSHIDFAYQSFKWGNETGAGAAVSVIIAGFSTEQPAAKHLWVRGSTTPATVESINGYLTAAEEVYVENRSTPFNPLLTTLSTGNIAFDGGHLSSITPEQAAHIRKTDKVAAKYLRPLVGAKELADGGERYCLWLVDAPLADLHKSSTIRHAIGEVSKVRAKSTRHDAVRAGATPALFGQRTTQPKGVFLMVPIVTTINRTYLPVGIATPDVIPTNRVCVVANPHPVTFGVVQSRAFMLWVKTVGSRLGDNGVMVSAKSTYNTFPLPELSTEQEASITGGIEQVVKVRETYKGEALAHLYSPLTMPVDLRKAQQKLDDAVLSVYGLTHEATDEQIVEALMRSYTELTNGTTT